MEAVAIISPIWMSSAFDSIADFSMVNYLPGSHALLLHLVPC